MYYLSKFCRICIKTGVKLTDINTEDYDRVKLSDKLAECTKMVINKESLSTEICMSCVQKLRVSYEFQAMCRKSSRVLQGYLAELLSASEKIAPEQFVNSELRVTIRPVTRLNHQRKKRVSKEQRCSLLKKLLLKIKDDNPNDIKPPPKVVKPQLDLYRGGLRDLINFTKTFDYGYFIDPNKNYDISHLDRLHEFSKSFFYTDFSDFRKNILCVIENEEDSEEEELLKVFEKTDVDGTEYSKFEEVIVEPDLKIKKEMDFECEDDENFEPRYDYSYSNFVEVCYENESNVKVEPAEEPSQSNFIGHNKFLAEIIPIKPPVKNHCIKTEPVHSVASNNNSLTERYKTLCSALNSPVNESLPATELLGQFVAQFSQPRSRQGISAKSARCRTRGNPYINPQLQKQFQLRSFTCKTCNRMFKSPGYLNAHIVKLKHY